MVVVPDTDSPISLHRWGGCADAHPRVLTPGTARNRIATGGLNPAACDSRCGRTVEMIGARFELWGDGRRSGNYRPFPNYSLPNPWQQSLDATAAMSKNSIDWGRRWTYRMLHHAMFVSGAWWPPRYPMQSSEVSSRLSDAILWKKDRRPMTVSFTEWA